MMSDVAAREALAAFDRAALLVTAALEAVHLPLFLDGDRLVGHVARANPVWAQAPCDALVVMAGPETYISPNWYPSKAEHHRTVPTWAYITLHVRGRLTTFDDPAMLEDVVARLSARHEAAQPQPWSIADAPRDYTDRMLKGIVGVAIRIERIEGKRKLSQDKPDADFFGVIDALESAGDSRDAEIAAAMRGERPR